jgi:hypothetical protein
MKIIGLLLILVSAGTYYFAFHRRADNLRNDAFALYDEALRKSPLFKFPKPADDLDPKFEEAKVRYRETLERAAGIQTTGMIVAGSGILVAVVLIIAGFVCDASGRRRVDRERWGRD